MIRPGGLIAVVLLLWTPLASAASGSGSFVVEGSLSLPDDTRFSFQPLLAFNNGTEGLRSLEGTFPTLTVRVYESRALTAPALPVQVENPPQGRTLVLTDVALHPSGIPGAGYVGFYPGAGATAVHVASAPSAVHSRPWSDVRSDHGTQVSEDPKETGFVYHRSVNQRHLSWEAPGALTYVGPGVVKVMGLDLRIESAEGSHTFETGSSVEGEGPAREGVHRWVVLEFPEGSITLDSSHPWTLAAPDAEASWIGRAGFSPVSGDWSSGGTRYPADGSRAIFDGAFTSTFTFADGSSLRMLLALEGDLHGTTLGGHAIPLAMRLAATPWASAWLLFALGLTLVAAGAGFTSGAWYARRRGAATGAGLPFTAEDCCDAGAKAASEEDWAAAAKWFGRARAMAPTSARITADHAFALSQIGDVDQSLQLYEEASRLSSDGEADFNAALVALQADRPLDEVEARLERALKRSPGLVLTLEGDTDFRLLHDRPRYNAAVRAAWDRVEHARAGEVDG